MNTEDYPEICSMYEFVEDCDEDDRSMSSIKRNGTRKTGAAYRRCQARKSGMVS